MTKLTLGETLEALRDFDTPSITNVVATYPTNPLCLGLYNPWTENWYTDQSIRCMYPEMEPVVGYAVTCVYGLPDPNYSRLSFMDVVDALTLELRRASGCRAAPRRTRRACGVRRPSPRGARRG